MSYKCSINDEKESQEWEIVAVACICFENELWNKAKKDLRKYDLMFSSDKKTRQISSERSNLTPLQNFKRCQK